MVIISFRNTDDVALTRLKSLQSVHDKLLDKMFKELGSRFQRKELSDRFWDALPADIRGKYKSTISRVRDTIRDIISTYPQYFEQYKQQNRPYFQKLEKQRQGTETPQMELPMEETVEVSH